MRAGLNRFYERIQRVLAPRLEYSQVFYQRVLGRLVEPDTR